MGKNNYKNTLKLIILSICCLILFAGCHNKVGDIDFTSGNNTEYNGNKTINFALEVNEKGYYYLANNILYFYDMSSDLSMPMCSRTECSHSDENCDAYARSTYINGDISWQCDGWELMLYNDSLYMIERSKENAFYIVQYDTSFNNKNIITKLSDYANNSQILCSSGAYMIYKDYLYYCVYDYSKAAIQNDYIFKFHCMRVKLEKDAVPEDLGEFMYPGDYAEIAGTSAGINVMSHDDRIYYFASDYERVWVHQNEEQCSVMEYNTNTSELKTLYSSTSGWGTGCRKICGTRTCMDEDGIIYAVSDTVNIVAIDIQTGEKKKIYSLGYNGLGDNVSNLTYDGQYLYFIAEYATANPISTCLKAIDTDGKEIASYEFKVTDDALNRNGDIDISGWVSILGLDNRNIVVLSRCNAYENLKTDKPNSEYDFSTNIGIGLIPLSDFLEGKDITIKQIYKY